MAEIAPSEERALALTQLDPSEGPLVMLNLLRFKERAEYPAEADAEPCSGAEAFARYGAAASPCVESVGGKAVFSGGGALSLIARADEEWDAIALVEYPSIEAFMKMGQSEAYQKIAFHRTAALADSRLIVTRPGDAGLG